MATLGQARASAICAISLGEATADMLSTSRERVLSQFWQNLQARLQPAVPKERMLEPG